MNIKDLRNGDRCFLKLFPKGKNQEEDLILLWGTFREFKNDILKLDTYTHGVLKLNVTHYDIFHVSKRT